ncbi:hypothetical protein AB4Z52_18545 [Rhizobium sp. 2YAF20]|uniref:hypothetical protein n=1 Tax=Rhizobium sp. 2YAF20 TaxID=3233027 RepID=UPI003F9EADF6
MAEKDGTDLEWFKGMARLRQFPFPEVGPYVSPGQPEPDGTVSLGWDQNKSFPAYRVTEPDGSSVLVPFTPMAQFAPEGYSGDFVIEEFSDKRIKERYAAAKDDPQVEAELSAMRKSFVVPHEFRVTGTLDSRGLIDAKGSVDLKDIRRPAFFGQAPWNEPVAAAERVTTTVEVEVPREPYETIHMGLTSSVRIRGWHLAGDGVDDGKGGRKRILIVVVAGRSIETTAIDHPDDVPCYWDEAAGAWIQAAYPGGNGSEQWGTASWRNNYIYRFNQAGFDVLTLDKRGHGISGGDNDSNTNEQAEDIFRLLTAMETGEGLRLLTPEGNELAGAAAAGKLLAGYSSARELPVFVSGASQGCMVTLWAMHKNFTGSCDFERPNPEPKGPYGYNILGALLMAPFPGGLGYRAPNDSYVEASRRLEQNLQLFATSEVLASLPNWPSLMIARGLWDFSESLEGSFEAYKRATGPKAILAVRGPHGENEWGQENIDYMTANMIRFARLVGTNQELTGFPEPKNIRDIVEAAPPYWAPYSLQMDSV